MSELGREVAKFAADLQEDICKQLERLDGAGRFSFDRWDRPGGGGGLTGMMAAGDLFERAGVSSSAVWGEFDERALERLGGTERRFYAAGLSLVLHPANPYVPAVHANLRYLERGDDAWFGGGSDLTPTYPVHEDAVHFHATWKAACDHHDLTYYPRFKRWCDEYFLIPHRGEARGIGGIFFDDLRGDLKAAFAFVRECGGAIMPAYKPIARRRRAQPYGQRERDFQLYRRGRYVEFNLVCDRGTAFGLATHGRVESVLMSLPPLARWEYAYVPQAGSPEAAAAQLFQARDWLGIDAGGAARGRRHQGAAELKRT